MAEREGFFASFDDRRLFFRDLGPRDGNRPTVLCLPGLTRNSKDFSGFARRVAQHRRVICPDYRGRGRSQHDPDWRKYAPETILRDTADLMTVCECHRVVVVGTSFGGILGMALAVLTPSAVTGLVLNDIGPDVSPAPYRHLLDVIGRDHPLTSWDQAVPALRAMFPALTFQNPAAWDAAARNTWTERDDGTLHVDWDVSLARQLAAAGQPQPLWNLFRALRNIPVLSLRGQNSDILSRACFDRMAVEKPDILAAEIPGAAHVPTLDEPESRAALDDFLGSV